MTQKVPSVPLFPGNYHDTIFLNSSDLLYLSKPKHSLGRTSVSFINFQNNPLTLKLVNDKNCDFNKGDLTTGLMANLWNIKINTLRGTLTTKKIMGQNNIQ